MTTPTLTDLFRGGDYRFSGYVVAIFEKRSGQVRCVVENQDGILHIFNPAQLTKMQKSYRQSMGEIL